MNRSARFFILMALSLGLLPAYLAGQTNEQTYVWPKEPQVLESLKTWQGYKFGLLIHMGLYSVDGVIESWGLCPEDWVGRPGFDDYYEYAKHYRGNKAKFNPTQFDPQKWAKAFKGSGAKYMIYSTKHHDGFCLYDTKYTDFKVTDKGTPFSTNPKSNVYKEIMSACRAEGMSVGAYFSKPDWTTPYFWWPYYPPKDRNPTYDITKHPDRWKKFVDYTQNQINEITTEYGKVDILWLDGCWVLPKSAITPKVAEFCKYPYDMDINMKLIAEKARKTNPGMLVVDRWVQGEYENYLTPEQNTPAKALTVPWESCITMGGAWGWVPGDNYKSTKELVQLLVRIVAKGGNLLLGVGPKGNGEYEPAVYDRLAGMGKWLSANGEAIYETVPVEPFQEGKIAYTAKGANTVYAIYMPEKDEVSLPETLLIRTKLTGKLTVTLLEGRQETKDMRQETGSPGRRLDAKRTADGVVVTVPKAILTSLAQTEAVAIRISAK